MFFNKCFLKAFLKNKHFLKKQILPVSIIIAILDTLSCLQ